MRSKSLLLVKFIKIKPIYNLFTKARDRRNKILLAGTFSLIGFLIMMNMIFKSVQFITEFYFQNSQLFYLYLNHISAFLFFFLIAISSKKDIFKISFSNNDFTLLSLTSHKLTDFLFVNTTIFYLSITFLVGMFFGLFFGFLLDLSILKIFEIIIAIFFFYTLTSVITFIIATLEFNDLLYLNKVLRIIFFMFSLFILYNLFNKKMIFTLGFMPYFLFQRWIYNIVEYQSSPIYFILLFTYMVLGYFVLMFSFNKIDFFEFLELYEMKSKKIVGFYSRFIQKFHFIKGIIGNKNFHLFGKELTQITLERNQIKDVLIVGILLLLVMTIATKGVDEEELKQYSIYLAILANGWYYSYRISSVAMAREKKGLWIMKLLPLPSIDIIKIKYICSFIVVLIAVIFAMMFQILFLWYIGISVYLTLTAVVWNIMLTIPLGIAFGLYIGSKFPSYREKNGKVTYQLGTHDALFSVLSVYIIIAPTFLILILFNAVNYLFIKILILLLTISLSLFSYHFCIKKSSILFENLEEI